MAGGDSFIFTGNGYAMMFIYNANTHDSYVGMPPFSRAKSGHVNGRRDESPLQAEKFVGS